jgi:hypothetical protein
MLCCFSLGLMLLTSSLAMAECQVTASQPNLSYGRLSPAERQLQESHKITLAEKQVVIRAVCDAPSRIRLFVSSSTATGNQFGFGSRGAMKVTAGQAFLDDHAVRLSKVGSNDSAITDGGQASVTLGVNEGLAFIDGGERQASQASVTLTIIPQFENAAITDTTRYAGNIRVRVEAQ